MQKSPWLGSVVAFPTEAAQLHPGLPATAPVEPWHGPPGQGLLQEGSSCLAELPRGEVLQAEGMGSITCFPERLRPWQDSRMWGYKQAEGLF